MTWLKWAAAAMAMFMAAQAAASASDDPTRLGLDFFTAINEERWDDVLATGEALRALPAYPLLPEQMRARIAMEMGTAHYVRSDNSSALPFLLEARSINPGVSAVSFYLFVIYTMDEAWLEAADLLLEPGVRPGAIRILRSYDLATVARGLHEEGHLSKLDAYLRLLLDLWTPPEGPAGLDWVRQMVIEAHAKQGRINDAMDEARRLVGASALIGLRAERQYAELWTWSGFDALTDVRKGLERETEALRAELQSRRPALRTGVMLSANLLHLGDLDGAQEVAQSWLERIDSGEEFADAWEYRPMLFTRLADVLRARGEDAAAEAMYWRAVQAARETDHPESATPHIVDIAYRHVLAGQGQEALDALAQLPQSRLTSTGRGIIAQVRAIAAVLTGDNEGADAQLDYLREDNPDYYLRALLHLGRLEEAEAAMRETVSTPDGAHSILSMLHAYPMHELATRHPRQTQARANLLAVAARPDIAEAIEAAGRVLTFYDVYELDFDP